MDNYHYLIFPQVAYETSLSALKNGIPFGGTISWVFVVIMSNDSGLYPYAPLQAVLLGWPVSILCDLLFFIPAVVIWLLIWMRM